MKRDNNGGEENEKKKQRGGRKRGLLEVSGERERRFGFLKKMVFLFFFIFFSKSIPHVLF